MTRQIRPLDSLTPRECQVLLGIVEGLSIPEIAVLHKRSVKTIESQRLSLGRKLGARNRVELVRIAIDAGLISPSIEVTGTNQMDAKPWTSPDAGIAVFFPEDGRIRFVNRRYAEMHGYRVDDMEGMLVHALYEPEIVATFPEIKARLHEKGRVSHACFRIRKDGSKFFAVTEATMMCGANGEVLMYISTVRPASGDAHAPSPNGERAGAAHEPPRLRAAKRTG